MAFGSRSATTQLTDSIVREIRECYAAGDITYRELGENYGVSRQSVGRIVTGIDWRRAPGPLARRYALGKNPRSIQALEGCRTLDKPTPRW